MVGKSDAMRFEIICVREKSRWIRLVFALECNSSTKYNTQYKITLIQLSFPKRHVPRAKLCLLSLFLPFFLSRTCRIQLIKTFEPQAIRSNKSTSSWRRVFGIPSGANSYQLIPITPSQDGSAKEITIYVFTIESITHGPRYFIDTFL